MKIASILHTTFVSIIIVFILTSCQNKQKKYESAVNEYLQCLNNQFDETILNDSMLIILKNKCSGIIEEKFSFQSDSLYSKFKDSLLIAKKIDLHYDSLIIINLNKLLIKHEYISTGLEYRQLTFDGDLFTMKSADIGFNFNSWSGTYSIIRGISTPILKLRTDAGEELNLKISIEHQKSSKSPNITLKGNNRTYRIKE